MRVVVLSDIHPTFSSDAKLLGVSHLAMDGERNASIHPFEALNDLIERESLSADFVICAGDLGTKSHPATIEYSWNQLQALKAAVNADKLVATP